MIEHSITKSTEVAQCLLRMEKGELGESGDRQQQCQQHSRAGGQEAGKLHVGLCGSGLLASHLARAGNDSTKRYQPISVGLRFVLVWTSIFLYTVRLHYLLSCAAHESQLPGL